MRGTRLAFQRNQGQRWVLLVGFSAAYQDLGRMKGIDPLNAPRHQEKLGVLVTLS